MGCVYICTNNINGKVYIGKTIGKFENRKRQHISEIKSPKYYFHMALKKYGPENFTWDILFESDNNKELLSKERYFIRKYKANLESGYNMTIGGEGVVTNYKYTVEKRIKEIEYFLKKCSTNSIECIDLHNNYIEGKIKYKDGYNWLFIFNIEKILFYTKFLRLLENEYELLKTLHKKAYYKIEGDDLRKYQEYSLFRSLDLFRKYFEGYNDINRPFFRGGKAWQKMKEMQMAV